MPTDRQKAVRDSYIVQHHGSCGTCQYANFTVSGIGLYCRLLSPKDTIEAQVHPEGWCSEFIKNAVTR